MNRNDRGFRQLVVMISIVGVSITFSSLFKTYDSQQWYWVVRALLNLGYWGASFYPWQWDRLNDLKKILLGCICIQFISYFLPIEILKSVLFRWFESALTIGVVWSIILDNDEDPKPPKKYKRIKNNKKWSFLLNAN